MVLLIAVALFAGGVALSLGDLEVAAAEVSWALLGVVAVVLTPATIAVNAAELRAMARCLDPAASLPRREAVRVVLLATAANLLPLPGGAVVRIHALRATGATVARATGINVVAALLWVAAAMLTAGVAVWASAPALGALAVAGGVGGVAVAMAAIRPLAGGWSVRSAAWLFGVEVVTTLLHAARLWLVLQALGIAVDGAQALVLGAGAPLAAAAGVFPSGLGLAELFSALLAPVVALSASAGFAATAVARVVGLAATAPIALALGLREMRQGGADRAE